MLARPSDLLAKLRSIDTIDMIGGGDPALVSEWVASGVRFAASSAQMEGQYWQAVRELMSCIRPAGGDAPILNEGGIYNGCWLESTGTISAELLCRFLPTVAQQTFSAFARHQREDGLLPYKLTPTGPVFSQIQTVSPLARSVWTHYLLNGRDRTFLALMYEAMTRNDAWLARWRDTRGTGGVEAFCCYDTGHDLSPRFWHIPDSPLGNDPKCFNADNPLLPLVAPDLTANVACQRLYLAQIAEELRTANPGASRPRRASKRCSATASIPPSSFSTTSTTTASMSACNPMCCCGCSPARLAMTRCLPARSGATCSTPENSSPSIRSPRSRSMTRATIRPTTTTAGRGRRTSSA